MDRNDISGTTAEPFFCIAYKQNHPVFMSLPTYNNANCQSLSI